MSKLSQRKNFNYTLERLKIVKKMRTADNTERSDLMQNKIDSEIEQLKEEIKDLLKSGEELQNQIEEAEKLLDDIEKGKKKRAYFN
jgi:uncharacterized protein YlxW (UPF0749 family)